MKKKSASLRRGKQRAANGRSTRKVRQSNDDLRPDYDFATMQGGIRGKYVKRVRASSNIILLEPDVAKAFPNDNAVNGALRRLLKKSSQARS